MSIFWKMRLDECYFLPVKQFGLLSHEEINYEVANLDIVSDYWYVRCQSVFL